MVVVVTVNGGGGACAFTCARSMLPGVRRSVWSVCLSGLHDPSCGWVARWHSSRFAGNLTALAGSSPLYHLPVLTACWLGKLAEWHRRFLFSLSLKQKKEATKPAGWFVCTGAKSDIPYWSIP